MQGWRRTMEDGNRTRPIAAGPLSGGPLPRTVKTSCCCTWPPVLQDRCRALQQPLDVLMRRHGRLQQRGSPALSMLLRVGGGDPHSGLAPAGSAAPRPNDCRVLIGLSCACSSRGDDTGPWQRRNRHLWRVRRSWCARLRQPAPCVRWHCFVTQLHPFAVDEHRCAIHHRRLQHLRLPFLCLTKGVAGVGGGEVAKFCQSHIAAELFALEQFQQGRVGEGLIQVAQARNCNDISVNVVGHHRIAWCLSKVPVGTGKRVCDSGCARRRKIGDNACCTSVILQVFHRMDQMLRDERFAEELDGYRGAPPKTQEPAPGPTAAASSAAISAEQGPAPFCLRCCANKCPPPLATLGRLSPVHDSPDLKYM